MADEVLPVPVPVPIPAPADLKRKHEDLEAEGPEIPASDTTADSISLSESLKNLEEGDMNVTNGGAPDVLEVKRPRLDEKLDVDKNGYQDEKPGFLEIKDEKPSANIDEEADKPIEEDTQHKDSLPIAIDLSEKVEDETPSLTGDNQPEEKKPFVYSPQVESGKLQPSSGELEASKTSSHTEVLNEEYISSMDEQSMLSSQTISRKIEVPNNKVGVLIGKSGDTIRSLQNNSSAKIQITRDSETDPNSSMRPVEIIGTLENINKAEKLIRDVIAEADAGGSPALVARGFNNAHSHETGEQVEIKVPNEKVGLIIGKGGETIKSLQMRSGARIQLIQHGSDGEQIKERTVRLTGSKRQIETAREMIDEVMAQPVRTSSQSGGYGSQQGHRSRGPSGPPQWGSSRGMRPPQPPQQQHGGYDYQRGPYPNQNQNQNHHQYPPSQYGGYPQQQHVPSRNNYGPGWDNRPPSMQGPPAYDYYGGGSQADAPPPSSNYGQGPPMGPPHSNYNYGQDYGQHGGYGQSHGPPPPSQGGYGQSHAPPPYGGGYGAPQQQQPGGYGSQPGGGYPQDQYGKVAPPSYGGQPPQGQSYYGQGRGPPPGSDNTQYNNQNVAPPPQQVYPSYGSGGYPTPYSSADGYNQQPYGGPSPGPGYGQQQQQPVSGGYGQQQQQPVSGGYGSSSYQSSQPSNYPDPQQQPPAPTAQSNNAAGTYGGYQSTGDQAAYPGAYGQPVAAAGQQGTYDQSAQQQQQQAGGGYGNGAPSGAAPPVGY